MEDIERYKTSLIKLWKQSCANSALKINFSKNSIEIEDKILKFNVKDNYINELIKNTLDKSFNNIYWDSYALKDSAYFFTIEKKKLSITTLYVDVMTYSHLYYIKEKIEKNFFSKDTVSNVEACYYLNNESPINITNFLYKKSNNTLGCIKRERYGDNTRMRLEIHLLSYNNIFIPITFEELEELRCFELECRKKDDMADVFRNLTLLTPTQYKEFIMWKESQSHYDEIDIEKETKNAD